MTAAVTNKSPSQRLFCKRKKLERMKSILDQGDFSTSSALVFGHVRRDALEVALITQALGC